MNADHESVPFTLPETKAEHHWERVLDTFRPIGNEQVQMGGGEVYELAGRSVVLLVTRVAEETGQAVTTAQADQLRLEGRRTAPPLRAPTLITN